MKKSSKLLSNTKPKVPGHVLSPKKRTAKTTKLAVDLSESFSRKSRASKIEEEKRQTGLDKIEESKHYISAGEDQFDIPI
jgi:hypothetical protein